MVGLFTCAVLQLLYFGLLLFTPCLEPLLLNCRPECAALAASQEWYLISVDCVRLGDLRLISTCTEEFRGTWAGVGARSDKKHIQPLPGKPQFPWRWGTHPAVNQKALCGCYCLGLHIMGCIIEHFGVKTCRMFRGRAKGRERKGSRWYGIEQVWENSGMRRYIGLVLCKQTDQSACLAMPCTWSVQSLLD